MILRRGKETSQAVGERSNARRKSCVEWKKRRREKVLAGISCLPEDVATALVDGLGDETHQPNATSSVDQIYFPRHLWMPQKDPM